MIEDEMVGWHHRFNGHEYEQASGVGDGQGSLVYCSPWGCKEWNTTERLHFHALKKEIATNSSILVWRIPGTGEPCGLLSMGSHRVGHDRGDLAAAAASGKRCTMSRDKEEGMGTIMIKSNPSPTR